jgi:hypothetical protein
MRENDGRCFTCWFWNRRYEAHLARPDESFIVDGTAYMACPDEPGNGFKGFGGAEFRIKPNDGREVIISRNVWCQGDVAKNFRDVLPDNAVFLPREPEKEEEFPF